MSRAITGRQRKPAEERRRDILLAARTLAVKSGVEAVTARDVAKAAGVVSGLIHYYFGSVEELLAEAFELWADEASDVLYRAAGRPPLTRIAMLEQNLRRDHRFWHDALGAATRHRALRDRARKVTTHYVAWVQAAIDEGVAEGAFTCPDTRAAAWRTVMVLDGLIAMVFVLRVLPLDEARALLAGGVERELDLVEGAFAAAAHAS